MKVNDKLRSAGVIRMPVETDIPLSVPAKVTPVSFTGATITVATPDLSFKGKAAVSKLLVLPDGIHIYGDVKVTSGG